MTVQEAPVGLMEGRRKRLRPGNVLVSLEDLLIVSWEMPDSTLQKALPAGLLPVSSAGKAFASAVLFRNRGPRFSVFRASPATR